MRKDEASTHVTVLVEAGADCQVVSCLRSEWESEAPDLAALLARALPGGASRQQGTPEPPERDQPW